ncbi:hypothetical protein Pmani_035085 [Petrolisthes manimaculis]|uniref:Uncharacterized protein n=1 Tax=Petrolisthes manimaculis TaxID=1843537 RepID=A0AAE1NNQ4_9EUCA|nr:hypothetical protein Pmani_035085 [Petrolisthes manimaculis]
METTPTSREGEMKGRDNEAMERDEGDQNTRREGGKIHHHHHQEGRDNETIERDEGDHNTRREGGKNHQEGRDNEAMEGDEGYHQNTRRYSEKCSNDHHKNINVFSTISEGNDSEWQVLIK